MQNHISNTIGFSHEGFWTDERKQCQLVDPHHAKCLSFRYPWTTKLRQLLRKLHKEFSAVAADGDFAFGSQDAVYALDEILRTAHSPHLN